MEGFKLDMFIIVYCKVLRMIIQSFEKKIGRKIDSADQTQQG